MCVLAHGADIACVEFIKLCITALDCGDLLVCDIAYRGVRFFDAVQDAHINRTYKAAASNLPSIGAGAVELSGKF